MAVSLIGLKNLLFVGTFGRIYQGTLLSEHESETELGADQGITVKTVSGRGFTSSLIVRQNLLTCTDRNNLFEGADPLHVIIYVANNYVIIHVTDQSCVMIYTVDQSCYCLCKRQ